MKAEAVVRELLDTLPNWKPKLTAKSYEGIVRAGFTRATIKQAFVLTQIVCLLKPISVRGAFYRAVQAGIYPGTDDEYYRSASRLILLLRRAGVMPYSWIVDSTRRRLKPSSWSGLGDFLDAVKDSYRQDFWARQKDYIEFFVEKDAMAGVLEPITSEYDVTLNIIRGDTSDTFVWNIAEEWNEIEKPIHIYYLGDHDPSGLRIEQTLKDKLHRFTATDFAWERLAITPLDFLDRDILGFPIKGDRNTRAWKTKNGPYLAAHGDRCVEVDALAPDAMRARVRATIEEHIDQAEWARMKQTEAIERESLNKFVLAQKPEAA